MVERDSEQSIFLTRDGIAAPADRAAYLDEACGDDPALRAELDALLAATTDWAAGSCRTGPEAAGPRSRRVATVGGGTPRIGRGRRGGADRPVQAAAADRRRRHGHGLHGRADRAGPAQGRAQGHQAGHGQPAGHRPLRGRAAGAGDDGPPEHRQGARRRHHGQRPALLRHGAGQGRADHQVLRREPPDAARAAGAVRAVCQAVQHAHQKGIIHRDSSRPTSWSRCTTASRCPR